MSSIISIIIPCYNHGHFIKDAIASVEKCPRELYELIIVNDGSTDPYTQQVMIELEKAGYHVINQKNEGLGAARNTGIAASTGDFILPLDSDNKIYLEYLTESIKVFNQFKDVAVVYGKRDFFGENNIQLPQAHDFDAVKLALSNYIDACAVIRKSALEECGGFATNFPAQGLEDWDLWVTLLSKNWKFHFVDKVLFSYRVRKDSMSSEMLKPKNIEKNLEFFCRKHALLLRKLLYEQHLETRMRQSLFPFWLRKVYWRVRYKTDKIEDLF